MSIGGAVTLHSDPARRGHPHADGPAWRGLWRQALLGLCVLLVCAGCTHRAPAPAAATATVAAAPPAPVTARAAATSPPPDAAVAETAPRGAGPVVFVSPRHGYTVTLPCCWVGMPTTALNIEEALSNVLQTPAAPNAQTHTREAHKDEADPPLVDDLAEALELVAVLPAAGAGGAPQAQLTVSVLAGRGLTLDQYLAATAAELNAIANTEVQAARLDDALRADGLPVAVIEYRTAAARPVAGLQIAFYLDDLTHLAVLTFTTDEALYTGLAAGFADIARQVTLAGAPGSPAPG